MVSHWDPIGILCDQEIHGISSEKINSTGWDNGIADIEDFQMGPVHRRASSILFILTPYPVKEPHSPVCNLYDTYTNYKRERRDRRNYLSS